jgi:hypothetical protein
MCRANPQPGSNPQSGGPPLRYLAHDGRQLPTPVAVRCLFWQPVHRTSIRESLYSSRSSPKCGVPNSVNRTARGKPLAPRLPVWPPTDADGWFQHCGCSTRMPLFLQTSLADGISPGKQTPHLIQVILRPTHAVYKMGDTRLNIGIGVLYLVRFDQ